MSDADAGVGPGADVLALKAAAHVVSLGDPSPRKAPLSRESADLISAPNETDFVDTSLNQAPDQRDGAQITSPLVLNTYLMLKEVRVSGIDHLGPNIDFNFMLICNEISTYCYVEVKININNG